jgi:hypothetical protein
MVSGEGSSLGVGVVVKVTPADAYMLKTPLTSVMDLGVPVQTSIAA